MKESIPNLGSLVSIQTYNKSGVLYRQYNKGKIVFINSEWMVLSINKIKVQELTKQKWTNNEPTLWFFPMKNKHFFNVLATKRNNNYYYYINLASPHIYEDKTLKYIDYEIDVKISEKGIIKIVDFHEFERNAKKFSYSLKLEQKLYDSLLFVVNEASKKNTIFCKKYLENFILKNKILLNNL